MNQEKFNLNKARKEAEKHEKKSVSLVNELKIDKKEESQDFLEEELKANYWRDLFEEKLDKIKDDEDFKNAAINNLENDIKSGKNGDGCNAVWALRTISALKNLSLYKKEIKEKLKEIKDDKDFKKIAINYLEGRIKEVKNGNGNNATWALKTISVLKNISEFWQDLAQEKMANMARDNKEGGDIPKRPEIR